VHTSSNMTAAERLRRIMFGSDPIIRQSSLTIGVRSVDSTVIIHNRRWSGSPGSLGTFRMYHRQTGH